MDSQSPEARREASSSTIGNKGVRDGPGGMAGRFLSNPLGFLRRAFAKTVVGPVRYGRGGDYDAPRYWADRFRKYGGSLLGPGDEGLSEEDNQAMYAEAGRVFERLLEERGLAVGGRRVVEVGTGNGFFTELLMRRHPREFLGLDITDVLFESHRARFPTARFERRDITREPVPGRFEVAVMIDVVQHIVTREKFRRALRNVWACLEPGGVFLVSPFEASRRKHLYYVHSWTMGDLEDALPEARVEEPVAFRRSRLLVVRKP